MHKKLAELLVNRQVIQDCDKELYEYGLFILIEKVSFFVATCIIGAILGIVFESLCFFIAFMLLRQFAGGYHAPKLYICRILTSISFITGLIFIKAIDYIFNPLVFTITIIASSAIIIIFSPLDSKEKELSENEKHTFKIITSFIVLIECLLFFVFNAVNLMNYAAAFFISVEIVLLFLVAGIIKTKLSNRITQ